MQSGRHWKTLVKFSGIIFQKWLVTTAANVTCEVLRAIFAESEAYQVQAWCLNLRSWTMAGYSNANRHLIPIDVGTQIRSIPTPL
jgi:hypothetical protein